MQTTIINETGVLEAALEYIAAGLSVIPIRGDGTKRPALDTWKPYQTRIPNEEEVRDWFDDRDDLGLAILASGGLEVLDFDEPDLFQPWAALVQEAAPGVLAKLPSVHTPSGGRHVYYRCENFAGSMKLARDENGKTLIETRGDGAYVLAPPSPPQCHTANKPYELAEGPSLIHVPLITPRQRDALLDAARSFNRKPERVESEPRRPAAGGMRPGDDFNSRATWEEVLSPAGWEIARQQGAVTYWRRPGGDAPGHSATTGYCDDLLYCFTTNGEPFKAGIAYTKFTAYALLNHGGDYKAAANTLAGKGFGPPRPILGDEGEIPTDVPNEAPDDPHRLARLYLEGQCGHEDGRILHFWQDGWHRWDGTAYRVVPDDEVRANLSAAIKAEFDCVNIAELKAHQQAARAGQVRRGETPPAVRKVTQGLVGNVRQALTGMAVLPVAVVQPSWVGGEGPFPADKVLAARNGLFHLPSLVQGQQDLLKPTPRFFSPNVLSYNFEANAPEPQEWQRFLKLLWPDDPESIATLQEWFGYCLLPDTRQQKMLLLVGPKRSGKGTIARVLKELVGPDNVAGPTLSGLAGPFGLAPLLGKTVANISDARLGGRTDTNIVTERLLSISGEDTLTVERKHLQAVNVKLPTRFMILTNELPQMNDASGALAGRMILLRLTQSWFGNENVHLTDQLLGELPGILLWGIDGYARLRARGRFVQPRLGQELLGHLEDLGSPIGEFIRERCEVGPECKVPKNNLFNAWETWSTSNGRTHAGDMATFGRNLMAVVPTVRASQQRDGEKRVPTYLGIRLQDGCGVTGGSADCVLHMKGNKKT